MREMFGDGERFWERAVDCVEETFADCERFSLLAPEFAPETPDKVALAAVDEATESSWEVFSRE